MIKHKYEIIDNSITQRINQKKNIEDNYEFKLLTPIDNLDGIVIDGFTNNIDYLELLKLNIKIPNPTKILLPTIKISLSKDGLKYKEIYVSDNNIIKSDFYENGEVTQTGNFIGIQYMEEDYVKLNIQSINNMLPHLSSMLTDDFDIKFDIVYNTVKQTDFNLNRIELSESLSYIIDYLNIVEGNPPKNIQENLQKSKDFFQRQLFPKFVNDTNIHEDNNFYEDLLNILSVLFTYYNDKINDIPSIFEQGRSNYYDLRTFYRRLEDFGIKDDYLRHFESNISTFQMVDYEFIYSLFQKVLDKGTIESFREFIILLFSYYKFSTNYVILQFSNNNGLTQYQDFEYDQYSKSLSELQTLKQQIIIQQMNKYRDKIDQMKKEYRKSLIYDRGITDESQLVNLIDSYEKELQTSILNRSVIIIYNVFTDRIYGKDNIEGTDKSPNDLMLDFVEKLFTPFHINLIYMGIEMLDDDLFQENLGNLRSPINDTIQIKQKTKQNERNYTKEVIGKTNIGKLKRGVKDYD